LSGKPFEVFNPEVERPNFGGFMKLITGILITLAALTGHAQGNSCNMIKAEKEARDYLVASDMHNVRFIQPCLEIEIQKDINSRNVQRNFVQERLSVLNILAQIKQDKMSALIKCESTNTPGCKSEDDVLDADADAKRADVEKQRADGSRDW
jgi:hypothetical protein